MKHKAQYIPGALLLALGATPLIAGVTIPHTFQAGETAHADEVNENFDALQQELAHALDRIDELESDRDEMQAFHEHVEVIADPNYPNDHTVLFDGVNVQIVNGLGDTQTTNGLGNLIVGYNEPRGEDVPEVCSSWQYTDQTTCEQNGEIWAQDHKSGSHNIVGGANNAYASYGGLVVGSQNAITGFYSTITGGNNNYIWGWWSSISGGRENEISSNYSSVIGGQNNTVGSSYSSILGGEDEILGYSGSGGQHRTIPAID